MREVRIRDTLSGELRALDARPARWGSTPVARPSTAASTSATPGPSSSSPSSPASCARRAIATKLVVNVTDINDKIYVAAGEAGEPSGEFAARMTRAYFEDTDRLGLGRPDAEPLATETIAGIVALIADLIESGHAYESGGDVYFRVRSFGDYGKLSNRRPEDMDQGEEAGLGSLKENPLDFALWKAHKPGEDTTGTRPGARAVPAGTSSARRWPRPSWAPSFAIHGGGSDLVFPHHENEIAQSEAAGRPFAQIWMHNGMIETGAEKMSKSEGNIFQLSEALDRYGREAVVAYLISGHYRQPLAFGAEQMEQAVAQVERLRNFFRAAPGGGGAGEVPPEQQRGGSAETPRLPTAARVRFREALADDFNTPRAMAEVFELVGEANRGEVAGAARGSCGDARVGRARVPCPAGGGG